MRLGESPLPTLLHLWVFPQGRQNKPVSLSAADDCHFCLPRVRTHHHNCHQGALVQGAKKSSPSQRFVAPRVPVPNCCRVARKRLSLLSCRAPQAGGSCCVDSAAEHEVAGPLLKPLGVDGAPPMAVGEWLLPFIKRQTIDHFKQP